VTIPASIIAVLAAGGVAFILVAVLTEAMRRVAIRYRLVDQPRADRIHVVATPYLGGVAIAGGTLAAAVAVAHPGVSQALAIFVAGAAVSILGLVDDLRTVSPNVRLIIECVAAIGLVAVGVHMDLLVGGGMIAGWINAACTVIWIVVITNSFNLLDNMDGAAASIAFASCPILAVLALATDQRAVAALLIALSAGCAGFLVHNWHPAQIFMGDAGSLFIGFVISSATVMVCDTGGFSRASFSAVAAASLLMTFVPVVDTCTVMLSRQQAGYRWNQGGRDHIAHRLQAIGLRTTHTAILLSLTTAVTAVLGASVLIGMLPAQAALGATVTVGAMMVALAQKVEVRRPKTVEGLQSANRDAAVVS
jgi:UDP-GlcNAc:undecaprenyl-phosphate GlcNAc-1-phosphate transferase